MKYINLNGLLVSLIILLIIVVLLLKYQNDELETIKTQNNYLTNQLIKLNPYSLKDTLEIIEKVVTSELDKKLEKDNENRIYVELYPFLDYLTAGKYSIKIPNLYVNFRLGNPLNIKQGKSNYLIFTDFKINLDSTAMITCVYGKYYRSAIFFKKSDKWNIERSVFHE
ncbi:MAG TPA: hypothetical protein PLE30_11270 [Candidatus Kapabacteria bacterium]|nr:hypothetical protein [Candidatus Kapabacteria bacterium]